MGKYSSDSDTHSDKYSSKKSHLRKSQERSFSSDSSSSRTRRRKDKKVRPNRSRSRGNDKSGSRSNTFYHSSKLSRHSVSPDRLRRRSNSKDLYRSKRKSSKSKDRATRSSRSSLRNRYTKVNNPENRDSSRHRERSDNSSSSGSLYEKSISCSKANDSNRTSEMIASEHIKFKLNSLNPSKEESAKINSDILSEINSDSFASKQFISAKNSKVAPYNIVIDLKSQTIKVPDVELSEPDSIFHPNLFVNEEVRIEKWIKELYVYRQKTICDENTV